MKRKSTPRPHSVTIRVSEEEWRAIQIASHMRGMSAADLIRQLATGKTRDLMRVPPVPELNRRAYLRLGKLQAALEEDHYDAWGEREINILTDVILELKALRQSLLGIAAKTRPKSTEAHAEEVRA